MCRAQVNDPGWKWFQHPQLCHWGWIKPCSYSMTGRVENEQNAERMKHLALSGDVAFRAQDPICCVVETYGLLFLRPCPFMVLVSLNFVESSPCCFLQGHPRALRGWREALSRYSAVLWPLTLNKKSLLLGHVQCYGQRKWHQSISGKL